MPSDMPLHPESRTRPRPSMISREPMALEQSFPALVSGDTRTRAALSYAFPLLPGLYLLWRERRNRFVRLHAAQAVVFFGAVALAQIVLYVALVALGGWAPSGSWALIALGLLFWALYIALGLGGFTLWLRLLNDCAHGRLRRRPMLAPLSTRLEVVTLQFAQSASTAYHTRRNGAEKNLKNVKNLQ
jgi:uncharacterized membrane protein